MTSHSGQGGGAVFQGNIAKNRAEPLLPLKELFSDKHDEDLSKELYLVSRHKKV